MKRLKEKAAYQWQVLGWRGCVAMTGLFIGILGAFFDAYICADVAVELGDNYAAFTAVLCAVGGFILTRAANWLFRDFEKHPYKAD